MASQNIVKATHTTKGDDGSNEKTSLSSEKGTDSSSFEKTNEKDLVFEKTAEVPIKVNITDKATAEKCKEVIEVKLSFPKHWQIKKHPESGKLTADIIAWLKEMKLLQTKEDEILVQKFELSGYGGYCQPEGDYELCLYNAMYVTLWLLYDDKFVEKPERKMSDFADIIVAQHGKKVPVRDVSAMNTEEKKAYAFAKAWENVTSKFQNYIKTRCKEVKENIFERMGDVMEQWIYYSVREAKLTENDTNFWEFEDFVNQRIITIGMIPPAILLEILADTDRGTVFKLDTMQKLVRCSALIVAIANDLLSFPKDMDAKWANIVNAYMRTRNCNIVEAHMAIAEMNNKAIADYDTLFSALDPKLQKKLEKWAHYLRLCASGFSYWHTTAERYLKKQIVIDDSKLLKVVIFNE